MTTKEIRDLSADEIVTKLRESRTELQMLRLKRQTGQVEKTHLLRGIRKDIARFETIVRQKRTATAQSKP